MSGEHTTDGADAGRATARPTGGGADPGGGSAWWTAGGAVAAFTLVAVILALFQLYTAGIRPVGLFHQRAFHLTLIQTLAFLAFPSTWRGHPGGRGTAGRLVDGALIAGSLLAGGYIALNLDAIVDRAGAWTMLDLAVGVVAVLTLLVATRRVLGWGITALGMAAIAYAYAGPYLPGLLRHGGYSTRRIIGQLYLGQEGIFGIPLGVAATFVFVFILFGALLEVTGAGRFFMDLAYAVTGRYRGGPAKAAVLASAGLGSISGSAIANVVTSGAFTIPLMKRVGYRPEEAGGIEAAASTGGQVLPPIMGAGAFLIAEYTGLAYLDVVKGALIPALLYLATVFLFVHLMAARRNLEGLPAGELPRFLTVMRSGWHYLVAVAVLVGALMLDLSVARVGFIACVAVAVLAAMRGVVDGVVSGGGERLVAAFVAAGRNALPVSLACAVAGIIVGVVGLTGIGLKFSGIMLSLSQGSLLLALLLLIVASLVLGMGLPVTASYVVLIVLAGPVLTVEFGLPILIAHLVVFWYSQDSNVTPPVCLAAYAAAGIAGSPPMRTGLHAWKYAKGLYLIPLYMIVHPELVLGGPLSLVLITALVVMGGLAAFAAALEGYLTSPIGQGGRIALLTATLLTLQPALPVAVAGLGLFGLVALHGRRRAVAVDPGAG